MLKQLLLTCLVATSFSAVAGNSYFVVTPGPAKNAPPVDLTLVLESAALPDAVRNTPYSHSLAPYLRVTGDPAFDPRSVTWAVGDTPLPAGLALIEGSIVGTPTTAQESKSYAVVASYKDKDGQGTYTIKVGRALLQVKSIAAGDNHTCALTAANAVVCWGSNAQGQLGNGSTQNSASPVAVIGLTSGVKSIAVGKNHNCAVTTTGGAKCWGEGTAGRLGNGATVNTSQPVNVTGLTSGVASISAGGYHSCAVTTSGSARCWGQNNYGQLGNGATSLSSVPVTVSGLNSGVALMMAGATHTCAVTTAGGVKCWGDASLGKLGNGNHATATVPSVKVPGDVIGLASGVASITGENHTCVVMRTGAAKCWGYNTHGQLGTGDRTASLVPVTVVGLEAGVASIAAGANHTCAVTTVGSLKCWGQNANRQAVSGAENLVLLPLDVPGFSAGSVTSATVKGAHSCAVTTGGTAKCWGNGSQGKLGDGASVNRPVPVDVHE